MGLDCEYPNSCDCGCQDEPRHTGCKCCGREAEHSDDCLIPENARLRAALQKAEARVTSLIEEHLAREKELNEEWHSRLIVEAAAKLGERKRAEKAEAERDEARAELAFHRAANMALVKERDDAEKWLETNAEFANHWRARADRYLAAMTRRVDARDIGEVSDSDGAIRSIVEEARRG